MSLQPPVLPPIPRVASRKESDLSLAVTGHQQQEQPPRPDEQERKDTTYTTLAGERSAAGPSSGSDWRPHSSQGPQAHLSSPAEVPTLHWPDSDLDEPIMEATMFPRPQKQAPGDPFTAGPPMSRSFIDSRDRPYSHNIQRPPAINSSRSSPDVRPPRASSAQANPSLLPSAASPVPRLDHPTATTPEDARKVSGTNYSGSTARPSLQSSKSASASPLHQTIGTPYSETSASFPAPQHVATRPKTMGSASTIAGVMVPTHHSNSFSRDQSKPEKRKTRLLNPMSLLTRRRSGQDAVVVPNEAERRAHAQAQARQKSVATAGINNIPEDFDPRIRGKIVHDFNAPRPRRTFSSNDADFGDAAEPRIQSADSMPVVPTLSGQQYQQRYAHSSQPSDVSSRHSRHTPIFVEHLAENEVQTNAVQAEALENKDFLKRASHQSNFGQESSSLPPFARRSQQMDPMQASFFRDDDSSKRSSGQSSTAKRESSASSGERVSPVAAAQTRYSETSTIGLDDGRRPVSDMSMFGIKYNAPSSDPSYDRKTSEPSEARTASAQQSPNLGSGNENALHGDRPQQAQSSSPPPPKAIHPALRNLISGPNSPTAFQNSSSARSSPAIGSSAHSTPEPTVADAAVSLQYPSSPPRLVEKRASAVGHTKHASSLTPKHAASNASRFSFQLDASAAEEKALEEKHRRMESTKPEQKKSTRDEDDEDDDDYFDESAMDDEDEMEAEMRMHDGSEGIGLGAQLGDGVARYQYQPKNQAIRSDASSVYEDDGLAPGNNRETTYAEHPAFRGHSAVYSSKHNSMAPSSHYSSDMSVYTNNGWIPQHKRFMSDGTITTLTDSENDNQGAPRSNFYLQPEAAGYMLDGGSGGSNGQGANRDSTMTVSTVQSNGGQGQSQQASTAVNSSTAASEPQHPRFSRFKFIDSPERSRPPTSEDPQRPSIMAIGHSPAMPYDGFPCPPVTSPTLLPSANEPAQDPEKQGQSAAYHGSIGKGIRARNASINQNLQYAASESSADDLQDDMYFDDGGFGEDMQNSSGYGESINEEDLDHPDFAGGYRGMEPRGYHERHTSTMTITARDGPYPTFAIPNPAKAHQRESQMLLEDLPLHGPIDPRRVPQRNPSDDAKRLGLSDKVPPLPAQPGSTGVSSQMAAYHQALADAANRAAEDGRFVRHGSVSTTKSSVYSNSEAQDRGAGDECSVDEESQSHYSQEVANEQASVANKGEQPHAPTVPFSKGPGSHNPAASRYNHSGVTYTPPRMSGFDFGFSAPPSAHSSVFPANSFNAAPSDGYDTSHLDDGYDEGDDDFIAAANAEALAYDDAGYYGQEFGFYARARSDSAGSANGQTVEAINGGYFGEDGEDPLRRQKSLREPDLTPITERSEFSARNSFINFGPASASWGHGGIASPALARLPLSPLAGGGDGQPKSRASGGGYFGVFPPPSGFPGHAQHVGASPASDGPTRPWTTSDSPVSATSNNSSRGAPFSSSSAAALDPDATPRKPQLQSQAQVSSPLHETPGTAKKVSAAPNDVPASGKGNGTGQQSHSRNVSGADSVTYVRESGGEEGSGPPRWVLERRRTSEMGVDEVVGREVVKGGWI